MPNDRPCRVPWCVAFILAGAVAGADDLSGVAVEAGGSLVVVDRTSRSIIRVDPATRTVTTVSSDSVGAGTPLAGPSDIAVEPDGSLLVTVPGQFLFEGSERLVRVDPVSGDRTTLSDGATGTGPVLHGPEDVAVAADGGVFVLDDQLSSALPSRILQVDPTTGDRTTVAGEPGFPDASGLAVESSGMLVSTVDSAVVRVDPATGQVTVVSDSTAGTGTGPPMSAYGVAAAGDGTLAALDRGREIFCFQFCPGEICLACVSVAPGVMEVDGATGDRVRISGGGLILETVGGVIGRIGTRGIGPALVRPWDLAVESGSSLVVVDDGRVLRVNRTTGRRSLLVTIGARAAADERVASRGSLAERARRLATRDSRRVYVPRNPRAWLRDALGAAAGTDRPDELLALLPAAASSTLAARLYSAMWSTMRDVLGEGHPDVLEAR